MSPENILYDCLTWKSPEWKKFEEHFLQDGLIPVEIKPHGFESRRALSNRVSFNLTA